MAVIIDTKKDPRPSAWFDWRDGAKIEICIPDDFDMERIYDEANEEFYKEFDGNYQRFTAPNPLKVKRGIWDASIKDWDGIQSSDDVPLECSYDNKIWLMLKDKSFREHYEKGFKKLRDDVEAKKAELEKNLLPASSGNSASPIVTPAEESTKRGEKNRRA